MKKFINNQFPFIIFAIIIGFLLNTSNCIPDPYCDPDPLYGGCFSDCDYGTASQWAIKSFGIWVLLNLGSFFEKENLKKKENLKEFLEHGDLKYTVRTIDNEWKADDQKSNEEVKKLLKSMEAKK